MGHLIDVSIGVFNSAMQIVGYLLKKKGLLHKIVRIAKTLLFPYRETEKTRNPDAMNSIFPPYQEYLVIVTMHFGLLPRKERPLRHKEVRRTVSSLPAAIP